MKYEAKIVYTPILEEQEDSPKANTPEKIVDYMKGAHDEDPTVEWVHVVLMDTRMHPIGRIMVTKGCLGYCPAHPREIFKPAIIGAAASIIFIHNHPSGDPTPSHADIKLTQKIKESGKILGIPLNDHIIIGRKEKDPEKKGYYSFSEALAL